MCHSACVEVRGQLCGVDALLHLCIGFEDHTQVGRLVWQVLPPLSHLNSPLVIRDRALNLLCITEDILELLILLLQPPMCWWLNLKSEITDMQPC